MFAVQENVSGMMNFPIGGSGQRLVFTTPVIDHFLAHRQTRWWHRESGGQLFARFELPDIIIVEATGPRRSDWRARYSYRPSRRAEQREIIDRHRRGLHFVGDWHTHPEDRPTPSGDDTESMKEMVARSTHSLNAFVLVIVGRLDFPEGLSVRAFYNAELRAALILHSE
jgi:integrative and conjugative element protein (TIGR02256 family)